MAYSELIKNFNGIRDYIRSFYVYGFNHRNDYTQKSTRSYDNERRRVESWLGDYMTFGQDNEGRRFYISVDSRAIPENPLYRAFRTKSFTDKDIMLHFHILDILAPNHEYSVNDILDELYERLDENLPEESTIRKKLSEYVKIGLIEREKQGKENIYRLSRDNIKLESWTSALAFFSEIAPLGVIGSFINSERPGIFYFKHHYILNALDSEILCDLFMAVNEKRSVKLITKKLNVKVFPLKIYVGTQTGRQYLLAWSMEIERFYFYRLDLIEDVEINEKFYEVPELQRFMLINDTENQEAFTEILTQKVSEFTSRVWGVSGGVDTTKIKVVDDNSEREKECRKVDTTFVDDKSEHEKICGKIDRTFVDENSEHKKVYGKIDITRINFTLYIDDGEEHIIQRLEREKRCGKIEKVDANHWEFSAEVFDALEMLPFLRTFIGRITDLQCSDERVIERFNQDVQALSEMYKI
ncbi:MAG: winged helix-turn-helix transcriptional regulator [Synergistaceae bacterium]|nr:winged helix-turn-helix transcriptional regulator [Synergistaceae bacterium]